MCEDATFEGRSARKSITALPTCDLAVCSYFEPQKSLCMDVIIPSNHAAFCV